MKGKNQRSVSHKANVDAQQRVAELEAEVERLRDIENVGRLHVQALGEIERLSAKVSSLEATAREAERVTARYQAALSRISELTEVVERRGAAITRMVERQIRGAGKGRHPFDVIEEVAFMWGVGMTHATKLDRVLFDKRHQGLVNAAGAGELNNRSAAKAMLEYIDAPEQLAAFLTMNELVDRVSSQLPPVGGMLPSSDRAG